MKNYFILNYNVTDKDKFSKYGPAVRPILGKLIQDGKAKLLINSKELQVLEGEPATTLVIVEFENKNVAEQFYNSKEYQDIIGLRTEASKGWAVLVDEFIP